MIQYKEPYCLENKEINSSKYGLLVYDSNGNEYRINFFQCITRTFAINHIILYDILVNYPFINDGKTSNTMINKETRFLLYWWFATNIFMTCGRHNRLEPSVCLI